MTTALDLASSIRQALKSLEFEIADLKRNRRGLTPFELDSIQQDLNARAKARWELTEFLKANNLTR